MGRGKRKAITTVAGVACKETLTLPCLSKECFHPVICEELNDPRTLFHFIVLNGEHTWPPDDKRGRRRYWALPGPWYVYNYDPKAGGHEPWCHFEIHEPAEGHEDIAGIWACRYNGALKDDASQSNVRNHVVGYRLDYHPALAEAIKVLEDKAKRCE
jgi:hypothetical protein